MLYFVDKRECDSNAYALEDKHEFPATEPMRKLTVSAYAPLVVQVDEEYPVAWRLQSFELDAGTHALNFPNGIFGIRLKAKTGTASYSLRADSSEGIGDSYTTEVAEFDPAGLATEATAQQIARRGDITAQTTDLKTNNDAQTVALTGVLARKVDIDALNTATAKQTTLAAADTKLNDLKTKTDATNTKLDALTAEVLERTYDAETRARLFLYDSPTASAGNNAVAESSVFNRATHQLYVWGILGRYREVPTINNAKIEMWGRTGSGLWTLWFGWPSINISSGSRNQDLVMPKPIYVDPAYNAIRAVLGDGGVSSNVTLILERVVI